ncbi:hypothetical protein BGX34_004809 [Mortierella sp. NVP85]|nr:hypothetical protein BGX34_004809 [Mortierella sp. NVP85]
MDKISAPSGIELPVVDAKDLYVREAYKSLHDTILDKLNMDSRHIVVTGTTGVGKSAFLVYFAIRLLAENSPREPLIPRAKTVIAASPKTLYSDAQFKDVEKEISWKYHMAPWDLDELKECRNTVANFENIPEEVVVELYSKIGGVPRYVLKWARQGLTRYPEDLEKVKSEACERLEQAIKLVDDPVKLMQCFSQAGESLEFSSRLLHRWPNDDDHRSYRLEWASTHVLEKITASVSQDAWNQVLEQLIKGNKGSDYGVMFEAYVLRTFRQGGKTFEIRDLGTREVASLEFKKDPDVDRFDVIPAAKAGKLCIPRICNYACIDMLRAPNDLFQITTSNGHLIKGQPLVALLHKLEQAGWTVDEARFIFVVPGDVYDGFRKQNYLKPDGTAYERIPKEIQLLKQYVLKIDLKAAVSGNSPGLNAK